MESRADRPVKQHRGDGRVDSAGKPEHHLVVADLRLKPPDRVIDPGRKPPVGIGAADAEDEIREYMPAVLGVDNFRMELDAEETLFGITDRGAGTVRAHR